MKRQFFERGGANEFFDARLIEWNEKANLVEQTFFSSQPLPLEAGKVGGLCGLNKKVLLSAQTA